MNSFNVFILNIFINSFLAFFTVAILLEILIFIFRIKQGRFASILRMLPIIKLPLDLFFYNFSRWSYLKGINPLITGEGTRTLSVMIGQHQDSISDTFFLPITSVIQFTVGKNMTFTIADVMSHLIPPSFLRLICICVLLCSVILVLKKLINYFQFISFLKIEKYQKLKKIRNISMNEFLQKRRVRIVVSSLFRCPFVAGLFSHQIYFPENLCKNLSRKEYEAILAHEIEHIRYKDNFVRFVLIFICSAFWWIPSQWLQKRIEEGQEIASDAKCQKYGILPLNLASAICKSAKFSLNNPSQEFTHHLTKHAISKRIHMLLQGEPNNFRKISYVFCFTAANIAFFIIFLGKFWIF